VTAILDSVVEEGERLLGIAKADGATLALLGGVAVRVHAPEVPSPLDRQYKDLDFAVPKGRGGDAANLLRAEGYEPEVVFNAMNGKERMIFNDLAHDRQIDVFVGSFRMCHEISFKDRLKAGDPTIPLAELLLTKLQIVELNEKDVRDTVLLFHGHDVTDHDDDTVNGEQIARLCGEDWGLWRTITANLARCKEMLGDYALPEDDRRRVAERVSAVLQRIEDAPKSRGWKLRAKIGERKRWYDLPEEVDQ
jgi:hypothetical protein